MRTTSAGKARVYVGWGGGWCIRITEPTCNNKAGYQNLLERTHSQSWFSMSANLRRGENFVLLYMLSICVMTEVHLTRGLHGMWVHMAWGGRPGQVEFIFDSQHPVATDVPPNNFYDVSLIPRQIFKDKWKYSTNPCLSHALSIFPISSLSDVPRFHLIYRILNFVINKRQEEQSHKLDPYVVQVAQLQHIPRWLRPSSSPWSGKMCGNPTGYNLRNDLLGPCLHLLAEGARWGGDGRRKPCPAQIRNSLPLSQAHWCLGWEFSTVRGGTQP